MSQIISANQMLVDFGRRTKLLKWKAALKIAVIERVQKIYSLEFKFRPQIICTVLAIMRKPGQCICTDSLESGFCITA